MARIKIELPASVLGTFEIPVRITDLNYGNHLGNDSLVSIIHEARVQWLHSHGYSELNLEGASLILAGLLVEFSAESFYGDILKVTLLSGDLSRSGFELFYHIECERDRKKITVAKAKTEMVFFDYHERRILSMPENIRKLFPAH